MRGKNGETDCLTAKREEADRGIALVRETGEIKNRLPRKEFRGGEAR